MATLRTKEAQISFSESIGMHVTTRPQTYLQRIVVAKSPGNLVISGSRRNFGVNGNRHQTLYPRQVEGL